MTGGRLRRVREHLLDEELFCMTYGDGVADVDIQELIRFARDSGTKATLTATQPPGRFGALQLEGSRIRAFREKPEGDGGWINGGFFVLHPDVIDYVEGDATVWEREPLERLASEGELSAYFHRGFWQPLDTLRDKRQLEQRWEREDAPWKVWNR